MTTGFIMQTLIYIINTEFLSLSCRRYSLRNVLSGKEQGEQLFSQASHAYYLALSSLNLTPYFLDLARCISQFQRYPFDHLDGQQTYNRDFDHNFSK